MTRKTKRNRPAAGAPIKEVRRRFTYVGKEDMANRKAIIAHIGTAWESIMGTLPFTGNVSVAHKKYIVDFVHFFYRRHPDHPYNPDKRIHHPAHQKYKQYLAMTEQERNDYFKNDCGSIDVWFDAHKDEWERDLTEFVEANAP